MKLKRNYKKQKLSFNDWLIAKNKTIGGSEASAVCNKSKWLTPQDLYNKFVYGKAKVIKENARMRSGTMAEPLIRSLFGIHDKRYKVINPPKRKQWFFTRKDKPYISVTPDGLLEDDDNRLWGLEIKNVELRKREEIDAWESNQLPDQYYYQVLQYFVVMNDLFGVILLADLNYFRFDEELQDWVYWKTVQQPYYIVRDDVKAHIEYLEKKETQFYEENVLKHKRPKVVITLKY